MEFICLQRESDRNNTHNKYLVYIVYCKVTKSMENRQNRGLSRAGQFVAFNRVLRRVHMCLCTAVRGGGRGANKEEVIDKQEHSKGVWLGYGIFS